MQDFNFNLKNSIFTKQAIKAAREKAIKKDVQDLAASSNEVKNLLEQKCDNAGIFRDLTDEEVEARLKAEEQSPLSLIKNLINNKHKIDSSASPQNDAFRHTEQSEVSQSIQGDGEILRHFVPQNDVLPTTGAMEDSETVLIPNDGDSGVSQQLVTEFTPNSGDIGISQQLVTSFTPTPTPVENRANATSSLTIKDADGAKPQTLAAGDKLNVTYVYEGKTYNYTIEAKSAQNVTLQTKDGYFTVVGDNLAVQTGDEQYSFVALIGTTNSIKIGTNGKTYNGNSIAYNSDEGGHSVYTWGDDPTPTMSRGDAAKTIEVYPDREQVLLLTNPFTGKNYTYTLKMRDDITTIEDYNPENCAISLEKQIATFEFLANGRLVITGNYLDITSGDGQQDDIILLGHYNNLSTGDEADTVRVGYVRDSYDEYYLDAPAQTAENGNSANYYKSWKVDNEYIYNSRGRVAIQGKEVSDLVETDFAHCAIGNHISTGSGDDYVTYLLLKQDSRVTVDMGEGEDYFLISNGINASDALRYEYSASRMSQLEHLQNAEIVQSFAYSYANAEEGYDGWARQHGGNCVTLSYINALSGGTGKADLSKYVNITKTYDASNKLTGYNVEFPNYTFGTNTVNLTLQEVNNAAVFGDIDTLILEAALDKLVSINKDSNYTTIRNGLSMSDKILNRYFFGLDSASFYSLSNTSARQNFLDIWALYENGLLTNEARPGAGGLIVSTNHVASATNRKLGITDSHAYVVKNVAKDSNGDYYVEVINPWDDKDVVRFTLDYFISKFDGLQVIGYNTTEINTKLAAYRQS